MSVLYMATQIMQCKRFSSPHHKNRVHCHRLVEGRKTISQENRRRTVASWRTSFLKAAIGAPRALSRTLPSRHVGNIVMPCLLCTLDEICSTSRGDSIVTTADAGTINRGAKYQRLLYLSGGLKH